MNPISIFLLLLVGNQIITSFAVFSNTRRDLSHTRRNSLTAKHRIVFQVNVAGQEQWQEVLANVENLQKAFAPQSTQIKVVCFGKGIDMLLNSDVPLADRIGKDRTEGVTFAACENTLRARSLTRADLLPSATIVDSGVAEIVRKQEAGWAYIKGG